MNHKTTTIFSWNVNGVRAVERRGLLSWMQASGGDVFAFQETKAAPAQLGPALLKPAGFSADWCAAERPGYSGVATFSREAPLAVARGLDEARFDCEGRVLVSSFAGFTLWNIYAPSGTTGPLRVAYKLDFYRRLTEVLAARLAAGERLVVVGDLNIAYAAIDLARPRQNRQTSGFLPEERAALGQLFDAGLVDSFRALWPDVAKYSWWSQVSQARARNIGWRLDYILVSANMRAQIVAAEIHPDITGSDHCPVSVTLHW